MRKVLNAVLAMLLVIACGNGLMGVHALAKAGDDPGVSISANSPIQSNGNVDLTVTLAGSAGKLKTPGEIQLKIPKTIVADSKQLQTGLRIDKPFYVGNNAVTDDGQGNFILTVNYDSSQIDQQAANGYTFTLRFRASYFEDHSTLAEQISFSDDLIINGTTVSSDQTAVETVPSKSERPAFTKYTNAPGTNVNGEFKYVMSTTNPSDNNFVLIVNYNEQTYSDLTVVDQLLKGLSLADSYSIFPTATGNDANIKHLKIYRVTFDEQGNKHAQYVTDQFANDIQVTDKTVSVHFGRVEADESYVISYGASVDDEYQDAEKFGTEYNHAEMRDNGNALYEAEVPLILSDTSFQKNYLLKTVDKTQVASETATLQYGLDLGSREGVIPAGTVVSDPLPEGVTFSKTVENSDYSDVTYDEATRTVSYVLQHDLNPGQHAKVVFNVKLVGDDGVAKVVNKASYTYAGSTIFSNDVTTYIDSALLHKTDEATGNPLAGAVFKLVDAKGRTVKENLTTDESGTIHSGVLRPGDYSFIETKAPTGYVLDETPVKFTVVDAQLVTLDLTMFNHQPRTISVSGQKTWEDQNNIMNTRPAAITIDLYRNGQKIDSQRVSAATQWQYHFDNLPEADNNGTPYDYTVREEKVAGYTTKQDGYNFTNVLNPIDPVVPIEPNQPNEPDSPINPEQPETSPLTGDKTSQPTLSLNKEVNLPDTSAKPSWWLTSLLLAMIISTGVGLSIKFKS